MASPKELNQKADQSLKNVRSQTSLGEVELAQSDGVTETDETTPIKERTLRGRRPKIAANLDRTYAALEDLFTQQTLDLRERSARLTKKSELRMWRYDFMRAATVILMMIALLTTVYSGGFSIGFDNIMSKIAPIVISCGILFYVINAFFRDYEVAVEASREAQELDLRVRKAEIAWTLNKFNKSTDKAAEILTQFVLDDPLTSSAVIKAEKVRLDELEAIVGRTVQKPKERAAKIPVAQRVRTLFR